MFLTRYPTARANAYGWAEGYTRMVTGIDPQGVSGGVKQTQAVTSGQWVRSRLPLGVR